MFYIEFSRQCFDLIYNDCSLLKRQNAFQQAELSALAKLKFIFQFCTTIIAMAIFKFSLKICCQIYDLAPTQCGCAVSKNIAIIVLINPPCPASRMTVLTGSVLADVKINLSSKSSLPLIIPIIKTATKTAEIRILKATLSP